MRGSWRGGRVGRRRDTDPYARIGRIFSGVVTFPSRTGALTHPGVALIEGPLQARDFVDWLSGGVGLARQRFHRDYAQKAGTRPERVCQGQRSLLVLFCDGS